MAVLCGIAGRNFSADNLVGLNAVDAVGDAFFERIEESAVGLFCRRADNGKLAYMRVSGHAGILAVDSAYGAVYCVFKKEFVSVVVSEIRRCAVCYCPVKSRKKNQGFVRFFAKRVYGGFEFFGASERRKIVGRNPHSVFFPAHNHHGGRAFQQFAPTVREGFDLPYSFLVRLFFRHSVYGEGKKERRLGEPLRNVPRANALF